MLGPPKKLKICSKTPKDLDQILSSIWLVKMHFRDLITKIKTQNQCPHTTLWTSWLTKSLAAKKSLTGTWIYRLSTEPPVSQKPTVWRFRPMNRANNHQISDITYTRVRKKNISSDWKNLSQLLSTKVWSFQEKDSKWRKEENLSSLKESSKSEQVKEVKYKFSCY